MKRPYCEIIVNDRVLKKYKTVFPSEAVYLAHRNKLIRKGQLFKIKYYLSEIVIGERTRTFDYVGQGVWSKQMKAPLVA